MAKSRDEAIQEGKRAAAMMKFGRWKIHAWLGEDRDNWRWGLVSLDGHLQIRPDRDGGFSTVLSDDRYGTGTPAIWHVGYGPFEDPNEAVLAQVRELARHIQTVMKVATAVFKALGEGVNHEDQEIA